MGQFTQYSWLKNIAVFMAAGRAMLSEEELEA